jgi:O-antigen ligase
LGYAGDFPALGSGLGTFGRVFPRYQSAHFGDREADFLHNDWLQLVCEMGLAGAGIVLAGTIALGVSVVRAAMRNKLAHAANESGVVFIFTDAAKAAHKSLA